MLSFLVDEEKTTTCSRMMNERKEKKDKLFLKSDLYRDIKQKKKNM